MQQCRAESEGAVELSKELELVKEQRDGILAQLSLARREIAQLKARNEVQRAARVFVRLEDTQNVLADTEHALGCACKALEHTRAQHKAQISARCRKDERTQMTVRDRLEEMMREREVMHATNARLRSEIEKLTSQLNKQLEANPPGALPEVRSRIARQEQLLKQQEERCARLHREVEVWKERACNALALERLTALHVGPNSMVPPIDEEAKARRSAEEVEERRKLNAEIAFWKAEALQVQRHCIDASIATNYHIDQ